MIKLLSGLVSQLSMFIVLVYAKVIFFCIRMDSLKLKRNLPPLEQNNFGTKLISSVLTSSKNKHFDLEPITDSKIYIRRTDEENTIYLVLRVPCYQSSAK